MAPEVHEVGSIDYKPSNLCRLIKGVNRRQAMFLGQFDDELPVGEVFRLGAHNEPVNALMGYYRENALISES
jgi:hypothetical protein